MTTDEKLLLRAQEVAQGFNALHDKITTACEGHALETIGAVTAEMSVTAAVRLGMPKEVYMDLVNRSWAIYGDAGKAVLH